MKTIKSKIMDIYKEISDDNSRSFANRKFHKEYLGSMVINYRRRDNQKLVLKIYRTKLKNGTEVFIDNTVYFVTVIDGITVIYNEYGKAVSISFNDGYEWVGETSISEEAIILENNFRLKYQNFINELKSSRDIVKMYNDSEELLNILNNTTCICDTTEIYNNLNYIHNYLYNSKDMYFNSKLNNVKFINNSLENYKEKEEEIDYALSSLSEYYTWLINLERVNKNNLSDAHPFFKLINEMKNHINKLLKKMTISQKEWDLLEYYHDEIKKMIDNNEQLTTNFSSKNRNTYVNIEYIDLNEDNHENNSQNISKKEDRKIFKKSSNEEKTDYLTFKTLRKYGVEDYQFDAEKITVKNAKRELKQFNKTQNKYEKLFNRDNNIDNVSYEVYDTIKSAKKDLIKTGIQDEKNSSEIFNNTLRNNNARSVYLKRQEDLKKSANKINKIKDIVGNMSDESFNKIKENYLKVKKRLIGLGASICAGVLAISSFGVGAYKNHQKNLENNSLVYENNDISIYGDENQTIEITNEHATYEQYLVGLGVKIETETDANVIETETEANVVEIETETKVEETETEANVVETETETKVEETEKSTEHFEEIMIVPSDDFKIENIETVLTESNEVQHIEPTVVNETNESLKEIQDEKDLLNTYKNELQNLESLLPQSNIELENVRNIGDIVNVTNDANLQNDEYSLIKKRDGHQSIHKDNLPRIICSIIMSDGKSGITAKTMEEAESLLNQGYYVAGYGVLNPYSKDASNLEGFFESEDVVGLVRR